MIEKTRAAELMDKLEERKEALESVYQRMQADYVELMQKAIEHSSSMSIAHTKVTMEEAAEKLRDIETVQQAMSALTAAHNEIRRNEVDRREREQAAERKRERDEHRTKAMKEV